jgi:hypothetical protein
MGKFEIGQLVVCVDDGSGEDPNEPLPWLEIGRIYTISGFCTKPHGDISYGVYLEELRADEHPNWCDCFRPSRLRPVQPTDINELAKLVAPVRQQEPV